MSVGENETFFSCHRSSVSRSPVRDWMRAKRFLFVARPGLFMFAKNCPTEMVSRKVWSTTPCSSSVYRYILWIFNTRDLERPYIQVQLCLAIKACKKNVGHNDVLCRATSTSHTSVSVSAWQIVVANRTWQPANRTLIGTCVKCLCTLCCIISNQINIQSINEIKRRIGLEWATSDKLHHLFITSFESSSLTKHTVHRP